MAGSEFPLTLLLQVQNDMSTGVRTATQDVQQLEGAANNAGNATGNLEGKVKSTNTSFVQLGLGIAAAASGVLNIIRQYHNLQKAQRLVQSSTGTVENATINLKKKQDDLAEAIKEHGENSEEAAKATDAVTKAQNSLTRAQNRLTNSQTSLNDRMLDFAFSIGPSIVGVVAGLGQTFDILSNRVGGTRGLGVSFLKLLGPLAILGVALAAIKFNIFGFRDAVQGIGVALGNAIPGLKPFLNFLQNIGIVFGLLPGDIGKAKLLMNSFIGDVVRGAREMFGAFSNFIQLLMKGDFVGAFEFAKESIDKLLPGFRKTVSNFFKDPIKTTISLAISVKNWVFDQKIGGFTIDQLVTGWGVMFEQEFKKNPVQAGINLLTRVVDFTIMSLLPADWAKMYKAFADEFDRTKGANVGAALVNLAIKVNEIALEVDKFVTTNIREPLTKWAKETFTLANFVTAINTIGTELAKVGTAITNFIFAGLTEFSTTQLDPFLESLFKVETWTTALGGFATEAGKILDSIIDFIFNPKNAEGASTIGTSIATAIGNGIKTMQETDWGTVGQGIIDGIGGWFTTNFPKTTAIITDMIDAIITGISSTPDLFNKLASQLWEEIKKSFLGLFGGFKPTNDVPGGRDSLNPLDSEGQILKLGFGDEGQGANKFQKWMDDATTAAQAIVNSFSFAFISISAGFSGLANTVSAVMNSFGANARSGATQIINAMAGVFTNVSAGMTGLANTWSAICNSFGANAKSGANQIIAAFKAVQSALSAAFKAMAAAAKSAFAAIVSGAKAATSAIKSTISAANSLVSALNRVTSAAKKAAAAQAKVGMAKGGVLSFASGGVMSAATGKMFTANGATQITVGDNPGGRETIAFIPHNDPGPTLEKIARTFGSFGDSRTGVRVNSGGGNSGSNGPMIVQVFLDGQQVKGAVVKMISVNSGGFK